MERMGVLVVTYGSRGVAIVDALCRSEEYKVEAYIVDRNRNPFNVARAKHHVVIPDLNVETICRFAQRYRSKIDFGIVGPEQPIINGVRDRVERETGIPMICPTKEYAIEGSKVAQRLLFQEAEPDLNPRFKVFDPKDYTSVKSVQREVWRWLDILENQVAVKPDGVTSGKGVGVWGDHFQTRHDLFEHFLSNYKYGPVIIEEKVFGEESSFQAFCDGKHLVSLPETRDYKRAFDGDKGPNTGGMGSYKAKLKWLPFMTSRDFEGEAKAMDRIFRRLKGRGSNPGLRGFPFYGAFMHTGRGAKILEINSRPGDPEILNILPVLEDDFVELCFRILEGTLTSVRLASKATVVTYMVPPTYGGKTRVYSGDKKVRLNQAYKLSEEHEGRLRVYPGSLELRNGATYSLSSRTVAVVGIADEIDEARQLSLEGIRSIKGSDLWYRQDIASKESIERSVKHMTKLRHLSRGGIYDRGTNLHL
jgi:phosphoribosylamine--glycine ligase